MELDDKNIDFDNIGDDLDATRGVIYTVVAGLAVWTVILGLFFFIRAIL